MCRTAFRVYLECAFCLRARFWRNSQIVVDGNRFNANSLANPDNTSIDGSSVEVTVKANLAPCQGAGKCVFFFKQKTAYDMIQGRSNCRTLFCPVILAQL